MAYQNYRNLNPKAEDTRYKINNNILRVMNANPSLGIGYIIGNAMGENYWGRKRAKSERSADNDTLARFGLQRDANGNVVSAGTGSAPNAIGANANGVTGVPGSSAPSSNSEWASRNAALEAYRNSDTGRNMYEGRPSTPGTIGVDATGVYGVPRTPQQSNTSGVTIGNVNNGGGISSVADAWNQMANNSSYNPGNTTLYTNGARDLSNVMPAGGQVLYQGRNNVPVSIGADANGVYGVPSAPVGIGANENGVYGIPGAGSAPSADNIPRSPQTAAPNPNPTPIPYTPEQLQQIKDYGGFTPDELQRMGAGELNAPRTESSSGGSGLLGSVVNAAVNAATQPSTPAAPATFVPEEDAAAMDRRTMFVPEEDAALEEGIRAANDFSRAGATRAGAANYATAYQPASGSSAPRLQVDDPSLPWWKRTWSFK